VDSGQSPGRNRFFVDFDLENRILVTGLVWIYAAVNRQVSGLERTPDRRLAAITNADSLFLLKIIRKKSEDNFLCNCSVDR